MMISRVKKDLELESFNVKDNMGQMEEIITAGQLLKILNSNPKEVSTLCRKACLKPKKDGFGNIYFSRDDIDVLKKVKELYEHTRELQEAKKRVLEAAMKKMEESTESEIMPQLEMKREEKTQKENFLQRAKKAHSEANNEVVAVQDSAALQVAGTVEALENNIVERISKVICDKMDGLDEVIVELIRAKTENESLRQKLNELNKENFNLKNENLSYKSVGLGFYVKKNTDDFMM